MVHAEKVLHPGKAPTVEFYQLRSITLNRSLTKGLRSLHDNRDGALRPSDYSNPDPYPRGHRDQHRGGLEYSSQCNHRQVRRITHH